MQLNGIAIKGVSIRLDMDSTATPSTLVSCVQCILVHVLLLFQVT